MLVDSAFLLLVGIVLAGLIHRFLNEKSINRLLSGGKTSAVFKAALFGVPLPLCSCSVLPISYQLRKSGLSKGGSAAFLISTPETGVDSILLTYSLTDPVMTIARPVTAFATALTAGLLVNQLPENEPTKPLTETAADVSCDSCSCDSTASNNRPKSLMGNVKEIFNYSMNELFSDLAPYLLFGFVLAGIVGALLGSDISNLPETFRSGWGSYIGAILVGLPLYICATSSTPLAAVLLSAGFSPGAVLVFLLVGPATNIASLTVAGKILQKKPLLIYLGSIIFVSVIAGLLLDTIYNSFFTDISYRLGDHTESVAVLYNIAALILAAGILYYSFKKLLKRFR